MLYSLQGGRLNSWYLQFAKSLSVLAAISVMGYFVYKAQSEFQQNAMTGNSKPTEEDIFIHSSKSLIPDLIPSDDRTELPPPDFFMSTSKAPSFLLDNPEDLIPMDDQTEEDSQEQSEKTTEGIQEETSEPEQ